MLNMVACLFAITAVVSSGGIVSANKNKDSHRFSNYNFNSKVVRDCFEFNGEDFHKCIKNNGRLF